MQAHSGMRTDIECKLQSGDTHVQLHCSTTHRYNMESSMNSRLKRKLVFCFGEKGLEMLEVIYGDPANKLRRKNFFFLSNDIASVEKIAMYL